MLKNKFLSFFLFFLITFSASFIGGLASIHLKEPWYSTLVKSNFNPPEWVFGPVWTILYFMMTVAIWNFWHSKKREMSAIYFIHLIVNTTWSIIFFAFHKIFLALIVLIFLIILIVMLIVSFKRVNMISYYLMIPYLLWCFYALFLNFSLLILN